MQDSMTRSSALDMVVIHPQADQSQHRSTHALLYHTEPRSPKLHSVQRLRVLCSDVLGIFFSVQGIFPFELTWVLTPFHQNLFEWECKPRSSPYTHAFHQHRLKRSWRSCPRRVNAGDKNTPSMHQSRRRIVTTSIVGLRNGHIRKIWISPKLLNPGDLAGDRRRRSSSRKSFVRKLIYFVVSDLFTIKNTEQLKEKNVGFVVLLLLLLFLKQFSA